jgi:L-iditol 2-dehydrogenase
MGGHVVAVGNLEKKAEFDLQQLVAKEHTFTGSYASSGEFRDCIELVASGKINVEPLVSDVLPLKEGPDAFDRLLKAEENLLKIVLEP